MADLIGRRIPLSSGAPSYNMAMDQTLLESVDRAQFESSDRAQFELGDGRPTLRLYLWDQPTLSLGYFQSVADRADHAESRSLVCVRRATGGGAIIHDHELTYSVVLPVARGQATVRDDLYRESHRAITAALADFGVRAVPYRSGACSMTEDCSTTEGCSDADVRLVASARPDAGGGLVTGGGGLPRESEAFLCFQRRSAEDLIVAGYKVLGSAQRRARRAVLQHGSLLLKSSPSAPQLPGINDLASRPVPADQLAQRLAEGFADVLGVRRWEVGPPSGLEETRARNTQENRFGHPDWLGRR